MIGWYNERFRLLSDIMAINVEKGGRGEDGGGGGREEGGGGGGREKEEYGNEQEGRRVQGLWAQTHDAVPVVPFLREKKRPLS